MSDIPVELPKGWQVRATPGGGIDLQVLSSGRFYIAGCALVLELFTAWGAASQRAVLSEGSLALRVGISLMLTLFAIWCAFADEVWHIEFNRLEHKVGIGALCYARRFEGAGLQIVRRYGTQ